MLTYLLTIAFVVAPILLYWYQRGRTPRYKYADLPHKGGFHIRLLTILPGVPGSLINCEVSVELLAESPLFEALSYVWGDASVVKQIRLAGKSLDIGSNLYSALEHLRYTAKPRHLWVDAVCINPQNEKEKSSQVASMPKIYAAARNVLVWLGEAEDGDDQLFDTLEKWQEEDDLWDMKPPVLNTNMVVSSNPEITTERYRAATKLKKGETLYFDDLETALTHWAEDPEFKLDGKEHEEGIKSVVPTTAWPTLQIHPLPEHELPRLSRLFLGRGWWSRLWVIQEVVYASRATIVCGKRSIPWEISQTILRRFSFSGKEDTETRSDEIHDILRIAHDIDRRREARKGTTGWLVDQQTLLEVVTSLHERHCTDPRDRIFAVLSLIPRPNKVLVPDYSLSVAEVFRQATKAIIEDTKSLNCICTSRCRECDMRPPGNSVGPYFPSWVPDWDLDPRKHSMMQFKLPSQRYSASGGVPIDEDIFSGNLMALQVSSITCGKIEWVSPLGQAESFLSQKELLRFMWKQLREKPRRYIINGEDSLDAFWRTLVKDSMQIKTSVWRLRSDDRERYGQIFRFWCNEFFNDGALELSSEEMDKDSYYKKAFLDWLRESWLGWTFCITDSGFYVLADGNVRKDDLVCIVRGADVPILLRYHGNAFQGKLSHKGAKRYFSMVGPGYVHGMMDGGVLHILKSGQMELEKSQMIII